MKTILAASLAAFTANALETSVQQETSPGGWTFYDPPSGGVDPCDSINNPFSFYFQYSYDYDLCTCMVDWNGANFSLCDDMQPFGQDPD